MQRSLTGLFAIVFLTVVTAGMVSLLPSVDAGTAWRSDDGSASSCLERAKYGRLKDEEMY